MGSYAFIKKRIEFLNKNELLSLVSNHYGLSIIESMVYFEKKIFEFDKHITRFILSSTKIGIIPLKKEIIKEKISNILEKNKFQSGYIRLVGYSSNSGCEIDVFFIPINKTLYWLKMTKKEKVKLVKTAMPVLEEYASIKLSGRYTLPFIFLNKYKKNYDECLFIDKNNFVSETTKSNVFFVKEKTLFTPKKGFIIKGVTRDSVIKIARKINLKISEKNISSSELDKFNECFLTGTYIGIKSVKSIDNIEYKNTAIAKKIRKIYFDILTNKT